MGCTLRVDYGSCKHGREPGRENRFAAVVAGTGSFVGRTGSVGLLLGVEVERMVPSPLVVCHCVPLPGL